MSQITRVTLTEEGNTWPLTELYPPFIAFPQVGDVLKIYQVVYVVRQRIFDHDGYVLNLIIERME